MTKRGDYVAVPEYTVSGPTGRWGLFQIKSAKGGERAIEHGSGSDMRQRADELNGKRR